MYYVQRTNGGVIVGAYRNPQPGLAEEQVADDDPELLAFFAGPSAAERLSANRAAALTGLLTRADDTGIAVRATVAAVTFLVNNRLELIDAQLRALGQPGLSVPRVLQAEILAYLSDNPTAGDPATG